MSSLALDAEGHLCSPADWTPEWAAAMAAQAGWQLTPEHLAVLLALREFYQRFGHAPATRPLIKYLQQRVSPTLGNAELMALFHTGLVARSLAKLAGLPKPANCL